MTRLHEHASFTEPVWIVQAALLQPKRATVDAVVPKHSYLRVHAQPKRFPAAYSVDWQVSCPCPAFLCFSVMVAQLALTHAKHLQELRLKHCTRAAQSRLIHVGEQFVVVSKPPGIPVVPCVCNILESCLACTAQVCSHRACMIHSLQTSCLLTSCWGFSINVWQHMRDKAVSYEY